MHRTLLAFLAATAMEATAAEPASPWHLDASAGSDFPLSVGARVQLEGPARLLGTVSFGVLPGPYLSAINGALVAFGVYPQTTADVIQAALKNALVFRVRLGWRPFSERGMYVLVGYGLATLGGGLTGSELVSALTRRQAEGEGGRVSIAAAAALHQLDAEVGWRWNVWRRLFVQAAVGGFVTLGSQTTLVPQTSNARAKAALQPAVTEGQTYLNTTFTSYVHSPTVSLQGGWQFF